jgi:hypothetical protein
MAITSLGVFAAAIVADLARDARDLRANHHVVDGKPKFEAKEM